MIYARNMACFIYLIRGEENGIVFSKIGVSVNPDERLDQHRKLQPHIDFLMVYRTEFQERRDALKIEKSVCRALRPYVFRGREYFRLSPEKVMPVIHQKMKDLAPPAFDLVEWLESQAAVQHRSFSSQINFIVAKAKEKQESEK